MRVGQFKKVWKYPTKNNKPCRLLCEEVDMGNGEIRTITSGVSDYYKPEELVGKQCIVVYNLGEKSVCISGGPKFTSMGMVLFASKADKSAVELVSPPEGTKNGEVCFLNLPNPPTTPTPTAPKAKIVTK